MKVAKVKSHLKKKKTGGVKKVRQHVRKIKTAADKPGAGTQLKTKGIKVQGVNHSQKNSGAVAPHAMPGNSSTSFKSPIHARMAQLRAMRGKKK